MNGPSLRTVANAAGVVVLLLALLLAVLMVAPGLVGAEASYVVTSDSMSPTIEAGDFIVVRGADADALSEGAILSYRSRRSDSVITHRIVGVEETAEGVQYRTKGDANEEADQRVVAPSQVVGTHWFTIPAVGHFVVFAQTDLGIILLVILPATALLASELYDLYRDAEPSPDMGSESQEPDEEGGSPE